MIFQDVIQDNRWLGVQARVQNSIVFFGSEACQLQDLERVFPALHFVMLKQVHGDTLVHTKFCDATASEADAHWTNEKNIGLIVKTADCIPLLITHRDFVCAVHAGWRGVLNGIASKSLLFLADRFLSNLSSRQNYFQNASLFIGPHIRSESFEVDIDVVEKFQAVLANDSILKTAIAPHKLNTQKFVIDLQAITLYQMQKIGIARENHHLYSHNTFTDPRFASYRRQRTNTHRNLSFVARLN